MRNAYLAALFLEWLNGRYETNFALTDAGQLVASDGARRLAIAIAPLWEDDPSWDERLRVAEERLAAPELRGAYLLWVPPRATVPIDEPDASYFTQRVDSAAQDLAPGERVEVKFPVTIKLAKLREEGGYASVSGGLSRWWTRVTENVQGTFAVDSTAVHRLTSSGMAREELWSMIGRLSSGIDVGQSAEFEIDEAWTLQRLPETNGTLSLPALSVAEGSKGVQLIGAPPGVHPDDGILVRRMARKRLAAANEALAALDVDLRAVAFIGSYEYAEVETASGTVKAIDPSLYSRLQVVSLLVDGEAKPIFAPTALSP
jgi:hypothetical protein